MNRAQSLIAQAEAQTGLTDWGAPEFRDGLERLCREGESYHTLSGQIAAVLAKRLRLFADRARYPEIAEQQIVGPIFVVGFPRSGTTILHSLLAADPRARSPLTWELGSISPPPRAETALVDPRIAEAQAGIERLPQKFRAMHAMGAMLPDEDNSIMQMAMRSLNFAAGRDLPEYSAWLLDCDMMPAFALHRHVLQHLQAFNPRDWWVLKAPPHLFALDALFETYPDARIVFTHRDPASIMASNASLIAFLREMNGEAVDPAELGRGEVAKWSKGMARAMAFRAGNPLLADRFFDLQYRDFVEDPLKEVDRLYDRLGIAMTRAAQASMSAFMADSAQGKHGAHVYSPKQFGLTAEHVRERFADYIDAYSVPIERSRS